MKKTKKAGPKAFGVRLEECQPGVNNKVSFSHLCPALNVEVLSSFVACLSSVHPLDCGDLLRSGGGDGPGIHRNLPRAGEQRHGAAAAGAAQQGGGHQPCRGGGTEYSSKVEDMAKI